MKNGTFWGIMSTLLGVMLLFALIGSLFLIPVYSTWVEEQNGKSRLVEASYEQRIAISNSDARLQIAKNAPITNYLNNVDLQNDPTIRAAVRDTSLNKLG